MKDGLAHFAVSGPGPEFDFRHKLGPDIADLTRLFRTETVIEGTRWNPDTAELPK
jgi:hypothetical protein